MSERRHALIVDVFNKMQLCVCSITTINPSGDQAVLLYFSVLRRCSPFLEALVLLGPSPLHLLQFRGLEGSVQWVS